MTSHEASAPRKLRPGDLQRGIRQRIAQAAAEHPPDGEGDTGGQRRQAVPLGRLHEARRADRDVAEHEEHEVVEGLQRLGRVRHRRAEHDEQRRDQPPGGVREAARKALQQRAAAPAVREQRRGDQGDEEQHEEEPQVAEAEAAEVVAALLDVPAEEVTAGQVVPERVLVAGVEAGAVPGLDRDQQEEHAGDERDAEPGEALAHVLPRAALAQREVGGGAGQQEEQLHVPHGDEAEHVVEGRRQLARLHVEGLGVEDPQGVVREEQQHGQHPQPVDEVEPVSGGVEGVHGSSPWSLRSTSRSSRRASSGTSTRRSIRRATSGVSFA